MTLDAEKPELTGGIAAVVCDEVDFSALLYPTYQIAELREEPLTILLQGENREDPDWLEFPEGFDVSRITVEPVSATSAGREIIAWQQARQPALMVFHFDPRKADSGRHLVSRTLDPVVNRIQCPVALLYPGVQPGSKGRQEFAKSRSIVPYSNDRNFHFAVETALNINPAANLTIVAIGGEPVDVADRIAFQQQFVQSLGELATNPRVTPRVILAQDSEDQLVDMVMDYDRVVFGAGRGNWFARGMLGDRVAVEFDRIGRRITENCDRPVIIVREYQGWIGSTFSRLMAHGGNLLPSVTQEEKVGIYKEVRRAARPRFDFFIMIALSAAIASLGLVLDSAAVIIGAMLIAPLMSAIIGMGLAMVQGDMRFLGNSFVATLKGALTSIAAGIVIGILTLASETTAEMMGRAGPTLIDLGVAMLSGAAAAYALCRKDMSASIPGVAISVALVPPLATCGLFIARADFGLAYQSLLLFMTNLAAIALSCGVVFTMVGFRPLSFGRNGSDRLLAFRRGFLIFGLLALAVMTNLTVVTVGKYLDTSFEDQVRVSLEQHFENNIDREVQLFSMKVRHHDDRPTHLVVTAASSAEITESEISSIADHLSQTHQHPIRVSVITAPLVSAIGSAERQ